MSIQHVQADIAINATPKTVWRVLTEQPSTMFLGATVETDWQVGRPIVFKGEWNGKSYEDHGEVKSYAESGEISFTHYSPASGEPDAPESYRLVRIVVAPVGERTRVSVTQSGGPPLSDEQMVEHRNTWAKMLGALKEASEADRDRRTTDTWEKPPQLGR